MAKDPQDARQALIERLRILPKAAAAAVAGLDRAQLDTPCGNGWTWTPRQQIHHLADSHSNAFIRTKLILTEQHPTLKPYDQDAWALLPDTLNLAPAASLAILRGVHRRWVTIFESLRAEQWQRSGLHPESGIVSLDDILASYAAHGEAHVGAILALRSNNSW